MTDRTLLSRIDLGPSIGQEPLGCILLYSGQESAGISLVATSREDGDAEVYMTKEEAKQVAEAILKAVKG